MSATYIIGTRKFALHTHTHTFERYLAGFIGHPRCAPLNYQRYVHPARALSLNHFAFSKSLHSEAFKCLNTPKLHRCLWRCLTRLIQVSKDPPINKHFLHYVLWTMNKSNYEWRLFTYISVYFTVKRSYLQGETSPLRLTSSNIQTKFRSPEWFGVTVGNKYVWQNSYKTFADSNYNINKLIIIIITILESLVVMSKVQVWGSIDVQ